MHLEDTEHNVLKHYVDRKRIKWVTIFEESEIFKLHTSSSSGAVDSRAAVGNSRWLKLTFITPDSLGVWPAAASSKMSLFLSKQKYCILNDVNVQKLISHSFLWYILFLWISFWFFLRTRVFACHKDTSTNEIEIHIWSMKYMPFIAMMHERRPGK